MSTTESMIGRISAILDCLTHGETEVSFSQICAQTGLAKSTVSRIVHSLVEYGYLERSGRSLSLGVRVFELGQQADRFRRLKLRSQPRMAELRRATRNTVQLAILEDSTVVYIEILQSAASPHLPSRIGGRFPAFATGVGKALLAYAPAEQVERVLSHGLWKVGPNTITDLNRFREVLGDVRASGVATEEEESGVGISCVAAPIFGKEEQVIAAVSVSGQSGALDIQAVAPLVRSVAAALSNEMRTLRL